MTITCDFEEAQRPKSTRPFPPLSSLIFTEDSNFAIQSKVQVPKKGKTYNPGAMGAEEEEEEEDAGTLGWC